MRTASSLTGILLIDKPQGWTSHDVVAKVRGLTRQRRIGHTGTLDPMATGLLVLCLGQATRLVEYMTVHDKRYEGEIQLGISTDTDDADGAVVARGPAPAALTRDELARLSRRFTGEFLQRPPAYSALKIGGRRAYSVARSGGTPQLAKRAVVIKQLRLDFATNERLAIHVHCGPGTYIRSLARDIGEELGCGAHLSALRRISVGNFRVESALSLAELESVLGADRLDDVLLAPDEGVMAIDAAILTTARASQLTNGTLLDPAAEAFLPTPLARIYDADGAFLGTGQVAENGQIRALKVLAGQHSP